MTRTTKCRSQAMWLQPSRRHLPPQRRRIPRKPRFQQLPRPRQHRRQLPQCQPRSRRERRLLPRPRRHRRQLPQCQPKSRRERRLLPRTSASRWRSASTRGTVTTTDSRTRYARYSITGVDANARYVLRRRGPRTRKVVIRMVYSAENAFGGRITIEALGLLDYRTCKVDVVLTGLE